LRGRQLGSTTVDTLMVEVSALEVEVEEVVDAEAALIKGSMGEEVLVVVSMEGGVVDEAAMKTKGTWRWASTMEGEHMMEALEGVRWEEPGEIWETWETWGSIEVGWEEVQASHLHILP